MNKRHQSHSMDERPSPPGMGGGANTVSMPNKTHNWMKPKGRKLAYNKAGAKQIKELGEV